MSGSMLWHDTRLEGTAPAGAANNIYKVNGSIPIMNSIGWIHDYAHSRGEARFVHSIFTVTGFHQENKAIRFST